MISALFGPDSATAPPGNHHSERRDEPKLTVCTGGKSHPQNRAAAKPGRAAH
jgi:hypothetical protein